MNRVAPAMLVIAGVAFPSCALAEVSKSLPSENPARQEIVATQLLPASLKSSLRRLAHAQGKLELPIVQRLEAARRMIEAGRANGDPRTLGYAQALLDSIPADVSATSEVLVLRATIEQSRHHFRWAAELLDQVIAQDPNHAQALLTRATIATVTGDFGNARLHCQKLRWLNAEAAAVCEAAVDAQTGATQRAIENLGNVVGRSQGGMRAWATGTLAQTLEQRGEVAAAMAAYRLSLDIEEDLVTRVGYANLLFAQRRHNEAKQVLASSPPGDAVLLLRLRIAKALGEPADDFREQLRERFAQAAARGELVHTREAAEFALEEGRIAEALRLARENWSVQREPTDLLVLLRTAHRAGDKSTKYEAAKWIQQTRLQDVRLATAREPT
jgi:Tfp pilus assembly protein PilF